MSVLTTSEADAEKKLVVQTRPDPAYVGPMPKTPLKGKAPFRPGWQNCATTDPAQLEAWKQIPGVTGFGGVAKAEIGGYWALETDSKDVAKRYKADTGESLPNDGLVTKSRQGGHRWFKHTPESIAMGNLSQADVVGGDFSVRAHNEQCVLPGSLHTSGIYYELTNDADPKEAPTKLIEWLIKQKKAVAQKSTASSSEGPILQSERNDRLTSIGGKLRHDGLEFEEIEMVLQRTNNQRCQPPLPESDVTTIARSVSRYQKQTDSGLKINGVEIGLGSASAPTVQAAQSVLENLPVEEKILSAQIEDMPDDVLMGRLGDVCQQRMASFPLAYSWLSLVVHAGLFVLQNSLSSLRTNLYFAPVGPPHGGKSMASTYARGLLGVEKNTLPLVDVMSGSAEGLIKLLGDARGEARLVNPDELGFLLERSSLDGASFPFILNRAYYDTAFSMTTAHGKMVPFNCRLSVIGGISIAGDGDFEQFGDLYGPKTVGGLYDRSLFGLKPTGFEYQYMPFEGGHASIAEGLGNLKAPSVTNEMWEAVNQWVKEFDLNRRTTESAVRVAGICAAYDGVSVLRPKDVENAVVSLASYETRLQLILKPNTGKNDDGILANKFLSYLRRGAPNGEWVSERDMLRNTHAYDLGARADRVLASLEFNGEIERGSSLGRGGRKKLLRLDIGGEEKEKQ